MSSGFVHTFMADAHHSVAPRTPANTRRCSTKTHGHAAISGLSHLGIGRAERATGGSACGTSAYAELKC